MGESFCMSSAYWVQHGSHWVITIVVSSDNNSQQLVKARPNNVLHSSSYYNDLAGEFSHNVKLITGLTILFPYTVHTTSWYLTDHTIKWLIKWKYGFINVSTDFSIVKKKITWRGTLKSWNDSSSLSSNRAGLVRRHHHWSQCCHQ